MHLQVKLAVPAVAGQSGFLRRQRARTLDRCQVLRENDAPLQFMGALVVRTGEIDCAARCPEALPVRARRGEDRFGCRGSLVPRLLKPAHKMRSPSLWGVSTRRCAPSRCIAAESQPIVTVYSSSSSRRSISARFAGEPDLSPMPVRLFPIRRAHCARAIRKLEDYRDPPLHPNRDGILRRVTARIHRDLPALPLKLAVQNAGPQIENLPDAADLFRFCDRETDPAEVKAVRILAQPVEERRLPGAARGVANLASEGVEISKPEIRRRAAGSIRRGVPAPLRLGAERHLILVEFREGLQPGRVGGEGKFAVTHRERRAGIKGVQCGIVSGNQRAPIDLRRVRLRRQRGGNSAEKFTAGNRHESSY